MIILPEEQVGHDFLIGGAHGSVDLLAESVGELGDLAVTQYTGTLLAGPVGLGIEGIVGGDEALLAGTLERAEVTAEFRRIGATLASTAEVLGSEQVLPSGTRRPQNVRVRCAQMITSEEKNFLLVQFFALLLIIRVYNFSSLRYYRA